MLKEVKYLLEINSGCSELSSIYFTYPESKNGLD